MGLSPMMQQYLATKEQYKDCLLFYRLGDFYEMFFEDAKLASKVLDLTLTGRNCGLEEKAPMCGVPYMAVETYIAKLISHGYKVAICEQMSEPVAGKIVTRDVTRVITPGTVIENNILDERRNNYIASIYFQKGNIGLAYADISTGEFKVCEFNENSLSKLNDTLIRVRPAEIICNNEMLNNIDAITATKANILPRFQSYLDYSFEQSNAIDTIKKQLNIVNIVGHDFSKLVFGMSAAGALITYLLETQKRALNNINKIVVERFDNFMYLDVYACKNLELTESLREQKRKGSVLALLDRTKTSMGARQLAKWLTQPLQNEEEINMRLNCVESLVGNKILLNDIQHTLSAINDIERLSAKISYNTIMPKDCISLKNSLHYIPELWELTRDVPIIGNLFNNYTDIKVLENLIDNVIDDEPAAVLSNGGFIKKGFSAELDELKNASKDGQKWLSALEAEEREKTGIKNLKIGYTRVFGYYIEISKSQENLIPYRYQRKQTISNHERYVTDELKQIEEKILNSEELAQKMELNIYNGFKNELLKFVELIQDLSSKIAFIDCIASFANIAVERNYVKPKINKSVKHIKIVEGRHPVVESILKDEQFVPNDALLDSKENRTLIITGPNMAGKSTYMRQIALITLFAHIGCFVPAKSAEICLVDRIFTRIGASDDLSYGQSTFMVEMVEVANIINNATSKSLLLLDEVGRGTSTYDGMSIAWAVIEYISTAIKAKTLFSTHYHEITGLEGQLEGVKNYRVSVKEYNNSVLFLRKIVRGGANRSFGIEVASLSGIYSEIINRAREILHILEERDINNGKLSSVSNPETHSTYNPVLEQTYNQLLDIDMNRVSPMEAFEILNSLVERVQKDKK